MLASVTASPLRRDRLLLSEGGRPVVAATHHKGTRRLGPSRVRYLSRVRQRLQRVHPFLCYRPQNPPFALESPLGELGIVEKTCDRLVC